MTIYLDSVILIYLLDYTGTYQVRARSWMAASQAGGDQWAVSDLTRLECRLKPIRTGDAMSLARFDLFFTQPPIQILPLTTAVYDRATLLRATFNFKPADALHLVAAVESGCDRFLTNDARLSRCTNIAVEVLP